MYSGHKYQNTGQLNAQIDELKKEVSALKEKESLYFFCPLLSGRYFQRRIKTNNSVILDVSE